MLLCSIIAAIITVAKADAQSWPLYLKDLGYSKEEFAYGQTPHFEIRTPVYPGVRYAFITFRVALAPLAPANSTVILSANGYPVAEATAAQLQKKNEISALVRLDPEGTRSLTLALDARLSDRATTCSSMDPRALWMGIDPSSTIAFESAATHPTIASFFETYSGRFGYAVDPHASESTRDLGVTIPYWLHRIERWHTITVVAARPGQGNRTLVLGDYSDALRLAGTTLYVSPVGLRMLATGANDVLIAESARTHQIYSRTQSHTYLTVDDLGVSSTTVDAAGLYDVRGQFNLSQIGGTPSDAHLGLDIAHSPFPVSDRAAVDVTLNGVLLNSFLLNPRLHEENLDVPIDERFVRSHNDLRLSFDYIPDEATCADRRPDMRVAVMPDSLLTWHTVDRAAPSVGDFFNTASGRVVVLLDGEQSRSAAAMLLDRLGALNANISAIAVAAYHGEIPRGYDYAIVVGPAFSTANTNYAVDPNRQLFSLKGPNGSSAFVARLDESYGILETLRGDDPPTLFLSYVGEPAVLKTFASVPTEELSRAQGDAVVFNASGVRYTSHDYAVALHDNPVSMRLAVLPVVPFFGFSLVFALTWISLRARRAS